MSLPHPVVVTGASTGIGRATTRALVERGVRVYPTVRREADAAELRTELGEWAVKRSYAEFAAADAQRAGEFQTLARKHGVPTPRAVTTRDGRYGHPVAGTLGMPAKQFFLWNVIGALLWTDGIILVGYLLAQQIYDAIGDKIDRYILPVVVLIVFLSVLPILIEMWRERKAKKAGAGVGAAESIAVVGVATVAGVADAIHDAVDDDEPRDHRPRHSA